MAVKIIAVQKIYRTQPGEELEVSSGVALALVRLGKARYAEEPQQPPKRRGRPPRSDAASAKTQEPKASAE